MSTGMTEVRARPRAARAATPEGARYEELLSEGLALSAALSEADACGPDERQERWRRYEEVQEELRKVGDLCRPRVLRRRGEKLRGRALAGELMELF